MSLEWIAEQIGADPVDLQARMPTPCDGGNCTFCTVECPCEHHDEEEQ